MKTLTTTADIGPGCLMSFAKLGVIIFVALFVFSCKTTKFSQKIDRTTEDSTAVAKIELTKSDSTSVVSTSTKDVNQTSNQTNDSSSQATNIKDKELNTLVTFGPNGGTYNDHTGDFTNVASISISQKEKELQTELTRARHTIIEYNKTLETQTISITNLKELNQSQSDSISTLNEKVKSFTDQSSTPKSSWYWWLIVGAICMFALIFIIKSYPATRWLLSWL